MGTDAVFQISDLRPPAAKFGSANISFRVITSDTNTSGVAQLLSNNRTYVIHYRATGVGTHVLAVFENNDKGSPKQLPGSPLLFEVTLPNCAASGLVVDETGMGCVAACAESQWKVGAVCTGYIELLASVIGPVLLCTLSVWAIVRVGRAEKDELRSEVDVLRRKLQLTPRDGFVLSSEWWRCSPLRPRFGAREGERRFGGGGGGLVTGTAHQQALFRRTRLHSTGRFRPDIWLSSCCWFWFQIFAKVDSESLLSL